MSASTDEDWYSVTFEGSRQRTLEMSKRFTLREKIEWLESAEELTLRLRQSRLKRLSGNPADSCRDGNAPTRKPVALIREASLASGGPSV